MKLTLFALALCSATVLADSRPFKFKFVAGSKTMYLTSTGSGSPNMASGVDCTINSGAIACGANKGGIGTMMHARMTPQPGARYNNGWKVNPSSNQITYAPEGKPFNIASKAGTQLWVENCDRHLDGSQFTKGKAYAVYASAAPL